MPLPQRRPPWFLFGAVVIIAALSGCAAASGSSAAPMRVHAARIELPPDPATAAVRFVIENPGSSSDRLVGVSSPAAGSVSVHRTAVNGRGLVEMRPVSAVVLRARSSVRFAPGGLHVMLGHLRRPLHLGDRVPLTLRFDHAPPLRLDALVVAAGSLEGHVHAS